MANTTNFGWETPDDTDLVKDGAAAIRTLGSAIDTSLVDLKGGTTGQVLAKNSNTDMDFTWTAGGDITEVTAGTGISGGGSSGAVTITNSMATAIDAKGDLVAGTGADAFARLGVGANGTVLTADSAETTGLKWATPSPGSLTIAEIASGSLSGSQLQLSSLTSYDVLELRISGVTTNTGDDRYRFAINNTKTGQLYDYVNPRWRDATTYTQGQILADFQTIQSDGIPFMGSDQQNTNSGNQYRIRLWNCKNSGFTRFEIVGSFWYDNAGTDRIANAYAAGIFKSSAAVSSIEFYTNSAYTFSAGSYVLWGA